MAAKTLNIVLNVLLILLQPEKEDKRWFFNFIYIETYTNWISALLAGVLEFHWWCASGDYCGNTVDFPKLILSASPE